MLRWQLMSATAVKQAKSKTLNKHEVIAILGRSKRTIETWISDGRLPCTYLDGRNGRQAFFDPADVARLKREIEKPVAKTVKERLPTKEPAKIAAPSIALPPPDYWADVAKLVGALAPAPARPWLTIDEATAELGLTRKWLLTEAESAKRNGAIRDMGKGARGGRWRFNREALAKS